MRSSVTFGLAGGGAVARSFIARHPWLAGGLGPVTASTFRLASRIANSLHAGFPVKTPAELAGCRTILISVPDDQLEETAGRIAAAMSWRGRHVIVCGGPADSVAALGRQGAECAGLRTIPGAPGWFAVDGSRRAKRTAALFAEAIDGRIVGIDEGGQADFNAGVQCAGELVPQLLDDARQRLRKAGLDETSARKLVNLLRDASPRPASNRKPGGKR